MPMRPNANSPGLSGPGLFENNKPPDFSEGLYIVTVRSSGVETSGGHAGQYVAEGALAGRTQRGDAEPVVLTPALGCPDL